MTTTLLEAARRLGIDTNTDNGKAQGETSAPEALTPEQIAQGLESYNKFMQAEADRKAEADKKKEAEKKPLWQEILTALGNANPGAQGAVQTAMKEHHEDSLEQAAERKPYKPREDWTEEERARFGLEYANSVEAAEKYAYQLNLSKDKAEKDKTLQGVKDWSGQNFATGALATAAGILASPLGVVDYMANMHDAAYGGMDANAASSSASAFEISQAGLEGVTEQLNSYGTLPENWWMIGGKGLGDLYGVGTSIAQSALTTSALGPLGTLYSYFGQSAARGVDTAKAKGATDGQALLYGALMGAAEAIPEMISSDLLVKLFKKGGDKAIKSLLKSVLKQAGGEAGEEAVTSILELVVDKLVFNETSIDEAAKSYMAQGMSETEAYIRAWLYGFGDIAYSAASGFVSGGVSGSGAAYLSTTNLNADNKAAKEQLTPHQSEMFEQYKTVQDSTDRAMVDKLAAKAEKGKELSGYDLRRLQAAVADGKTADVEANVKLAIAERLKSKGVKTEDISALTNIIMNKALGQNLTKAQQIRLKNSEVATAVANELDINNMLSGNFDSQWAIDAGVNQIRDTSEAIKRYTEQAETETADMAETPTSTVNLSAEAKGALRQAFTGQNGVYTPQSENTRIHTDEVRSTLNAKQTAQIRAIEKVANALGVETYIYESELKNGVRSYTTKDGAVITDNGYYDPKDKSVHIDLHAGETGKGTMLFTASHELVHWVKDSALNQYESLQKFVIGVLHKEGVQIDTLIKKQIDTAKANGREMSRDEALEEIVADACMSVLSTDAGIKAVTNLKTENRGLWNTLKRFFTNFFNRIDKIYKGVKVDSEEGQYLADMHGEAKRLRDLFVEGVAAASEANAKQTKATKEEVFKKDYLRSKDTKANKRYIEKHRAILAALNASASSVPMDTLLERYDAIAKIWNELGAELNSEFLKAWDSKEGKDRVFTIFKAQSGYKYNVELSSMRKKGIPLFEAIDTIVREEILNQLETKTLGKAEKEILYDLLKERGFDIPCAICYVEQARQREGAIIDAFLDGKIEKSKTGKVTQFKIGWNETFDALEKGMKSLGVDYKFPNADRSIATDNYKVADAVEMDAKTQDAFYSTLLALINKEIRRYNSTKDAKAKARMPLKSITPSEIKRCLSGTLGSNLKLYKTIAMNPASRFRIESDLLYSSMTTTNLATAHPQLYSLFNSQGGVSTFKTKQATMIYWGDIIGKRWDASKLRKEGGVRNQSNSDFMMYTLLDHVQMYMDFTAKGFYLQAYTKVLAELKLFGLSRGKINASFIPKVVVYYNEDGTVDYEKTRATAGLDEKGNPIYDDIEGVNHAEVFMLLEDAEYSKSIGGICIGYSDEHISKLLDDNRIQQIIGFHDKTDDPNKRYRGARYAKNYNGENEARKANADGTFETKHIGFNQFVIAAEKLFKKDKATESFSGEATYNGKRYTADDIPRLAADMYLEMCKSKGYVPAYDQFATHKNYYKLLADFGLYDSEGHYAPHRKVAYNMPDVVPYLDENGTKQYMPTRDYIKQELKKELTVRDDIAAALSDHSEEGLIPQFVERVNALQREKEIKHSGRGRGYIGKSMSVNAAEAYQDGQKPLSQWRKTDMIEAIAEINPDIDISKLTLPTLKDKMLSHAAWHHTSAHYNVTDFYEINEDFVRGLSQSDVDEIAAKQVPTVKAARDTSYDKLAEDAYAKAAIIVKAGLLKTETGALKRLTSGENFEGTYNQAVEILREKEAARVANWKKLAPNHFRQEFVKLFETDIHEYLRREYVRDRISKNSTVFKNLVAFYERQNKVKYSGRKVNALQRQTENSEIKSSPRKKRTVTLSVGEEAKFRANYTRAKVFSKSNMHRIIEKFIGKGELTAKTTEELADDMWISFNTATSVEERREFAHSAAEFVVAKLLQERKVESADAKIAAEQLLYLKGGIRRIEFTEQEIEEIRHKKDESGLKSIRARWGYQKSRTNDKVYPYPMDVFVTDVAREIPGMEHLADMNHIDAFFEIIEHYDSLKKTAADKWVSAYLETSDSDLESLQMEIEQTIFEAYETEGEESKFSKFVSAKIGAFQERALFWKAEHDNLKGRSRFENLIVDKARKFEELKKGTFLNATQYKADAFKDSIEKLSTLKFRGNIRKPNAVRDIFKPILEWYNKENPMLVDPNAEDGTPHKYSYEVAAMLEVIANGKDGLSNDELAAIYEVMNYFTKFIETYNKIWRNGKWIDAADVAQTDIEILKFVATSRSAKGIRRSLDKYLESFAEPMAYARLVDGYQNGFYTQTMTELREASIKAALEEMNIREDYERFLKDHPDYVKTASDELVEFKGVQIPKMHLIGLYMTYKRKHAQAGLIFNGFQFERRISKYTNETETISLPGAANPNAKLSQEEFDNLVNMEMKLISTKLSATDKAYIELLEKLYNGKLRDLKVRRDMDRLGFTNATLDYYYPIRRATIAKSIDAAVFDDVNRATNSSFNKNTVKGARQKLRIDSADALINRHIHEICNYAYMSGAIENYNTVFNIDISSNPNDPVSVRTTVEATNIWKKSQEYFRKLVKDMQGISGDKAPLMDAIGRLRSGYVRFALGLNLKTVFTQASSVFAATDVLDYSSIVKGMHLDSTGVDDYCPYAKLRNYDQSAIKALSVSDKVDKSLDWVTKGISFTDRVIICRLFGACQVQAEKNGAGAVGTEANKIAAGKLLEKVIIDTQSNSLATERSAAMRSDNEILKSIVMFTADSMKVASRVLDAAGELKMLSENGASEAEIKQAKVKLVKSVITVVNIAVYMTCIAQLFRWIYNRDEDEEEVPLTMAVDFIGNLFAGVPILSEIADFFLQGYEVENSVLDSANTILSGIRDLSTDCWNVMFNRDEAPSYQKWHRDTRTFIYAIAQMVGVPVRNVYNLISGIIGNFSEKAEYRIDDFFYENNYYSDLEEALQEENSGKVDLLLSLSYGKPFGEGVTDATVTELNRLARVDKKYLALPKTVPDKITRDGIEYTLTDNQKQQILTEYSKVNAAIDKLVNSASYQKLSDDKKAERLKYYYSEYFNAAVTKVLKLVKSNAEVLQGAIGFDTYAKFHFATKGIKSDTDKNGNAISGSKRKKVIAEIDKLNLTEEKRLLLIASKGYALTEKERTKLIRYINSLKLTESSKKALAEMCGFEVKNGKIVYK